MRLGLCAVLLIFAVGQPVPKQQAESEKHEQERKQSPTPPVIPPAPIPTQPAADVKQDGANSQPDKFCFQWLLEPLLLNWPLVAVGIGAIFIGWRTLNDIKKQTKNTEIAANAARDSAEAARHTVEIMRLDQRAWVGAAAVKIVAFHPGELVRVAIHIRNAGKTLARNVTASRIVESATVSLTSFHGESNNEPDILLLPNAEYSLAGKSDTPIDVQEFELIRSGKWRLYTYGLIQYRDISGEHRETGFSFIYNPDLNDFEACSGYNHAT